MVRGIMLDKFSNIIGNDLSVMGFYLFLFWYIKTFLLCSFYYGRKRYLLSVFLVNLIFNVAIVVGGNGKVLVFD